MAAGTILIAEDEPFIRDMYSLVLQSAGYRVLCVGNGLDAVATARAGDVDLILMDVNMPAMDGIRATQEIKSDLRLAPIPVVFISAFDPDALRDRVRTSGGAAIFQKPVLPSQLVRIADSYMRKRAA